MTLLPVGNAGFDARGMLPWFGIAGLVIGGMLAVVDSLAIRLWPAGAAAAVDTVFLVIVTGALHLDGLGDAADGLLGHHPPEKALRIMKDSRIGAMGLAAVVSCLLVKWAGISALGPHRIPLLILVPAFARASVVFGMQALPYGRPDGGLGHPFFDRPLNASDYWVPAGLCMVSLLLGWRGVWLIIAFAAVVFTVVTYYRRRLGCITGDMMGAMIEVSEAALFLLVAMEIGS
jgi:adenosylcobinamide-GDP ribazoletransferase